jgi:hypothetical protein
VRLINCRPSPQSSSSTLGHFSAGQPTNTQPSVQHLPALSHVSAVDRLQLACGGALHRMIGQPVLSLLQLVPTPPETRCGRWTQAKRARQMVRVLKSTIADSIRKHLVKWCGTGNRQCSKRCRKCSLKYQPDCILSFGCLRIGWLAASEHRAFLN